MYTTKCCFLGKSLKTWNSLLFCFSKNVLVFFVSRFPEADYIRKTFINHTFVVDKAAFIYDLPGKNERGGLRGGGVATAELAKIVYEAQDSIIAQTPYLVLDKITVNGVKQLRISIRFFS